MAADSRISERTSAEGAGPSGPGADEPWRARVLTAMLNVAAVIAPPLALLTLLARTSRFGWLESALIGAMTLAIVSLRFVSGIRARTRAFIVVVLLFGLGLYLLGRVGFVSGVVTMLITTSVLGLIHFGRRLAFIGIALTALAFLVVGALSSRGALVLSTGDLDPLRMRNWVRMGLSVAFVGSLLVLAVDSVIREVQAHAAAATAALAEIRVLEADRQLASERWQRGARELIGLGRSGVVESGDLELAFRCLSEAGARGLEVERCGVWLFDEQAGTLRCEDLFERTPERHSRGPELAAADAPAYFDALMVARSLAVEDVLSDPATGELREYLERYDIRSLLDAPIHFAGKVVGVVCHEQVASGRTWSPEARSFAASISDFASRALVAADRAAKAQDLRAAYEQLGALHRRLEAAKEDERRFLAHELHDELGQTLTALKLRLQISGGEPGAGGRREAGGTVSPEAVGLVDELIARVRRISVDLRPPLLDEVGLVPALRAYLDNQSALSGVSIELDADEAGFEGPADRLPADLEIACFRVVQESITNALRHGAPRRVAVRLARGPAQVSLSVKDDGAGFDPGARLEAAAADGHLGVVGMRERVRARGGVFRLASSPGAGTTVEVDLPAG